jgi:hypothetical protein
MSGRWPAALWLIANLLFPLVFTGGALYQAEVSPTISYLDEEDDDDGVQPLLAKARIAQAPPLTSTPLVEMPTPVVPFTVRAVPGPAVAPSRDRAPPLA